MYGREYYPYVHQVVIPSPPPPPPEPSSEVDRLSQIENSVIVEFLMVKFLLPEGIVLSHKYPNIMRMNNLKRDLARKFEINDKWLIIKQHGCKRCEDCMLMETDCNEFGIHEFELELFSNECEEADIPPLYFDLAVYQKNLHLNNRINVYIPAEDMPDGRPRDIDVDIIQNKAVEKPFLCGYKDKRTGIEYLDAFTQTGPYFDKWKMRRYYSRDTQTREIRENKINTAYEQASQCFLDGNNVLYLSAATDYTITPRAYESAAQKERRENKLAKIRLIQRNFRRVIMWRNMKRLAREYRVLEARRLEQEALFSNEAEAIVEHTECAKTFPRSKADFEMLLHEVAKWKSDEMKRIAGMYEGAARVAEVHLLLDREIVKLNEIERQRRSVLAEMENVHRERHLKKLGEPIKWIGYKDTVIQLDLLRTQRARYMTEIYKEMQKPLEMEARVELLDKVACIIKTEDFPDKKALGDLLHQEKMLLLHTHYCDLEILRKRQNVFLLELIKYSKDKKKEKRNTRMCTVCKKVKLLKDFSIRTRQNHVDTCRACYTVTVPTSDRIAYEAILRGIQREERKKRCTASFAFVMQVADVRYIIETIWHSHSILSKCQDLSRLRLPRWIRSDDWSPWNCVCLTDSEARDHYNLENLQQIYDEKLRLEVGNRHMLAKSVFHRLTTTAVEFVESGEWFKAGLNKQRQEPDMPKL